MGFGTNVPQVARIGRWLAVAAILGVTSAAAACIRVSDTALQIEASSAAGSGAVDVSLDALSWDAATQSLSWEPVSAVPIVDPETAAVIATLENAVLEFRDCSEVALEFELEAGGSQTTVVFRTGQLSFGTIGSDVAEGRATASFSLTDLDGDGAQMVGLGGGGMGAFRAYFNGAAPDGTLFAHLVALISISGGTGSASQRDPTFGYRAVGTAVSDMSVEVAFTLTPHDRLTGSTSFDVEPDPADCGADADADGLPDWLDGCPNDPEKTEPGDCGCGVPDVDSDADGIADCLDNCPDSANPEQEDADGDGVGDACDDVDGGASDDDPLPDEPVDPEDDGSPGDSESGGDTSEAGADDLDDTGGNDTGSDDSASGSGWPGDQGGGLFGFAPAGQATGDEDWLSGLGGLCGFGTLGMLPVMLLGLGACKVTGRRRSNRR